jgi:P4 family phage/plasmid primase-like protien
MSKKTYDLKEVKRVATGQWARIIQSVAGVGADYLTGRNGPCPKCGGKDRWRVFKDFDQTGAGVCNRCGKFADGLSVVRWMRGVTLSESIALVAESINLVGTTAKPVKPVDANLTFRDWNESLFAIWQQKKPGITQEAILACGGRMAKYRNKYSVLAIPIYGPADHAHQKPIGYSLYNLTGGTLPAWKKDSKVPDQVKILTVSGSKAGWMGPRIANRAINVQWKTEGPSDMLALLSLGLPPDHTACCNAFGCGENPNSTNGIVDRFKSTKAFVIHDCDEPGQAGATEIKNGRETRPGWAPAISTTASECRNVVLPYKIEPTHGKDLRDWINDRRKENKSNETIYAELLKIAESSRVYGKALVVDGKIISRVLESEDDPHLLARLNIDGYRKIGRDLRFWRGEFFQYKGDRYSKLSRSSLECRVGESIKAYIDKNWVDAGNTKKSAPKVSARLIHDVLKATASQAYLKDSQELNSWIGGGTSNECVALKNGILNLNEMFKPVNERNEANIFQPHSSRWFSCTRLPYEFDWQAKCPTWVQFINEVFNGDRASIECLQKWFGYLITDDTRLQKMLFVIGERRSGKGTILKTMIELLGRDAVASMSLSQLEGSFALQSLTDKTAVVIPDARLSGRSDEVQITERMLSISGEDPQSIDRKYMEPLNSVRLPVRFTLFSNMLPAFSDSANAFPSRCLFLCMPNSYLGREDLSLFDRIKAELPGILNWSIVGRWMLLKDKRIEQPESGKKLMIQMQSIASPVSVFLDQECTREGEVEPKELFDAWCAWCKENEICNKKDLQNFTKSVRDVMPGLVTRRPRMGGSQRNVLVGLSIAKRESDF